MTVNVKPDEREDHMNDSLDRLRQEYLDEENASRQWPDHGAEDYYERMIRTECAGTGETPAEWRARRDREHAEYVADLERKRREADAWCADHEDQLLRLYEDASRFKEEERARQARQMDQDS